MKKNIIAISIAIIIVLLMTVLSNIIIVAEKVGQITHSGIYGEIAIYTVLFLIIFVYLILPMWKVYKAPQLPSMQIDESMDANTLRRIGKNLATGFEYIQDKSVRVRQQAKFKYKLNHSHDVESLRDCINKEVQNRLQGNSELGVKGIEYHIKEWSKTVFMVTALSQNSKVDAISTLVLNFTMMKNMILGTGFRPNNFQLWRLYIRILITSLFSYAVSEAFAKTGNIKPLEFLNDIDFSDSDNDIEVNPDVDVDADIDVDIDSGSFSFVNILSNLKIPAPIVGSVLDGISNALLTLRIGYVTRSYLLEGQDLFLNCTRRKEIRRAAWASSLKVLPDVLVEGGKGMGKGTQRIIKWYTKRYAN
ncbi:MAG: hypothetical protein J6C86_10115 [Bacteroidaceae bacterium]|nr:hypothetical protein [Bacteroidaceae bacterium]